MDSGFTVAGPVSRYKNDDKQPMKRERKNDSLPFMASELLLTGRVIVKSAGPSSKLGSAPPEEVLH
jgi:hypothetical protein